MITVLTAALPERAHMLDEAIASVQAQTPVPKHLYQFDEHKVGAGPILNGLLEDVDTDWVMVLDDDDLLYPNHLATLAPHLDEGDVVWSLPVVTGGSFSQYERPWDETSPGWLRRLNLISHNACVRTSMLREVGGWNPVRDFDWDLFKRLVAAGARMVQVRDHTWEYRLHGSNWSQGTL